MRVTPGFPDTLLALIRRISRRDGSWLVRSTPTSTAATPSPGGKSPGGALRLPLEGTGASHRLASLARRGVSLQLRPHITGKLGSAAGYRGLSLDAARSL